LAKTISIETEPGNPKSQLRLETQVLHFDAGTWRPYTYIWNDEQTDAVLAAADGSQRTFTITDPNAPAGRRRLSWRFASRTECLLCHNAYGNRSILSFNFPQLNRQVGDEGVTANQIDRFSQMVLFKETVKSNSPGMASPHDKQAELDARARSYLHVNCGHCHRRGGGGTAHIVLQHGVPLDKTNALSARPTQGTFRIHDAEIIPPGDPFRSVLLYRMSKLGGGRMPHFGSGVVDTKGLRLLHDWISRIKNPTDEAPKTQPARKRQEEWLDELTTATGEETSTTPLIDQLFSSTSGALAVLYAIDENRLPLPVRNQVVEKGTTHVDVIVRDLFERFVPEEKRTKRLGSVIDTMAILEVTGQAVHGKKLFFESATVACRNCHQIRGKGRKLGPDLSGIGKKYSRVEILESIVEPSKKIDPKFAQYIVETTKGLVLSGLLISRDEKQVVLADVEAKQKRIPTSEVEFMAPQRKSLMPELLLRDMSLQQVADLLAYLSLLKDDDVAAGK